MAAEIAETQEARTTASCDRFVQLDQAVTAHECCRKAAARVAAGGTEKSPGGTSHGGYQAPSAGDDLSVDAYVDPCDSPGDIYLQLLQVGLPCICSHI